MDQRKTDREKEIEKQIEASKTELDKLKGSKIVLCGYCYHRHDDDWATHKSKSKSCYQAAWPCPLEIYERSVTFDKDGRAIIDWNLQ